MKRVAQFLLTISLLPLLLSQLHSQPWADGDGGTPNRNFYDIQKSFNKYWEGKDVTQKGIGWKQFKRWEWFWEQRVYPTGEFPNPMQIYNESKKLKLQKKAKNIIQAVGDWSFLGPSTNSGGYGGLGRVNCIRELPGNSSVLFAGAASGGLWVSTDGGTNWSCNTDDLATLGVTDIVIDPNNTNVMYLATGDGDYGDTYSVGVLKSTDGGSTWNTTGLNWTVTQVRTISRLLMSPSNSQVIYAGGSAGIYKTTNGGSTWSQVFSTSSIKDMEFKPGTPSTIYAARYSVYKSTDDGATWSQLTTGLPTSNVQRIALGVSSANSEYVYALMSNNTNSGFLGFYKSTNSGTSWTQMSTTPNILGWNTNGGDTGGQGWYDLCMAVSQTNANEVYTGGINIWKSTNGGTSWSCMSSWTSSVHADQHDLWFAPGTSRLYSGNDGGVYKTTNGGTSWSWIGSGLKITQFYRIGNSATNSNLVLAGAQDNGTKKRNGTTWSDVIGGDGMECIIDHSNSNIQYGELYYGQILKSTNGGSSFGSMTLPSEYNSSLGSWVTPYVMHPTNASIIYAGYRNVWKTTNAGSSWTQISNFTSGSLTVLHVAPSDPNVIYASTGSSTLKRTGDGGTNWTSYNLPSAQYLTYMAIHKTDPNKIWAAFSGYSSGQKVYYSTDGGANWTNISGSLPNVPVNTIVYQNDYYNRVYAGTDIGVFYKDDNTSDWQEFNTYLPNVVVNELEIHYGSSRIRAATYGRGLWEAEIPVTTLTLNPPNLSSPADNATDIPINTSLSWSSVTDATGYTIQYSTSSNFTTYTQPTASNTSLSITNLDYNTTYYWRVKATNGNISSNWSTVYNFTTVSLVLSAPTLNTPADASADIPVNTSLSWNSVENATGYVVQYSTLSDFSGNTQLTTTGTNQSISGLGYNTIYYWRVRATNGNVSSDWSSAYSFTTVQLTLSAPVLSSPSNGSTNVSINPALSWNSVANATGYVLQYSLAQDFSTNSELIMSGTSQALSGLSYNTQYYWRVKATNGSISSDWSNVWSFTTVQMTLSAPTLSSPANGATNISLSPTLSWNSVTNATGYVVQYSTASNFASYDEVTTSGTSCNLSGLSYITTYYWRVKATNGNISSNWSTSRNFTTVQMSLAAPILSSPTNNSTNVTLNMTFRWNSSNNASGYVLQYSKTSNFNSYTQITSTSTSASVTGLSRNTTYYWRVKATNGNSSSSWSYTWKFKTGTRSGKEGSEEEYSGEKSDQSIQNGLSINCYPNPLSGSTTVQFTLPYEDEVELMLVTLQGDKIRSIASGMRKSGSNIIEFSADNLASGTYMLVLRTSYGTITEKIIINK